MAITVVSKPYSIESLLDPPMPPVPVSDCWRWCLQSADGDAVTTPGSAASVVVTIPASCTVPANGTVVKIWGYEFTVDSSTAYTGTTFKVDALGLTTALNFASMIQANLFFSNSVTVTIEAPGSFVVTLNWNECREQPRFVAEQMVFTAITALGGTGTFTNGVSPVYVDGFKLITRIGVFSGDPQAFNPLTPHVGLLVDQQCTGVGEVCVDYVNDAETMLFTLLPDLTSTSLITSLDGANSMMRLFALEYGWVYRDNCQAKSGTIKRSDIVLGINAAFDIDDEYQMRRYWYGHPDGYPSGQFVSEFLTTQPKKTNLCWGSFAWLWLLNSWQEDQGVYDLVARFNLYNAAGTLVENFEVVVNNNGVDGSSFFHPVCFNVSPQFVLDNAPTMTAASLARYDVLVFGDLGGDAFNASEILTYYPAHCCDELTDLYVLTPPGGFATQTVEIVSREIVKDAQEVNLQVSCASDRATKAKYGGRTMTNLRAYEKFEFSFRLPNNAESIRWMRHVRQSPQTMIKVYSEGVYTTPTAIGSPLAKKFIIDPSSVTIYEVGVGLEFKATGYTADIPTQKGFEP